MREGRLRHKSYTKYKASGVEWLGDVPEHWEVKRFKQLGAIRYGLGDPPEYVDDGLPFVRATDIKRGKVDLDAVKKVRSEDVPWSRKPLLNLDEILVVRSGAYTGDSAIVSKNVAGCIAGYDMVLTVRHSHPAFVAWALLSKYLLQGQIYLERMRAAQPHLNAEELGGFLIFAPPPSEQQAIAAFLDRETERIDRLVAKKRELIERLKEKRSALISRTITRGLPPAAARATGLPENPPLKPSGLDWLGDIPKHWEVNCIGFLVQKVGSGKTPRGGSQTYQTEGVMLIRSQNVYDDGLRLEDVVFIDDETDEEMAGSRVNTRDVLLNITGASLGRCAVVPSSFPKANVNQHVCIIRPAAHKLDPVFAQLSLTAQFVKDQIFADEEGSSREGLNFQQVRNLVIPVPPLPEQAAISAYLGAETAKLDALVAKVEEAVERLQEYRTALITAAVTGKIDVRFTANMISL